MNFVDPELDNVILSNMSQLHTTTNYFISPGEIPIAFYDLDANSFTPIPSPQTSVHNISVE